MTSDELVWRLAGGSGDGIDSTSKNCARALLRAGLHVFTHRHYPSRIRGGHTYVEVRAAPEPVTSRGDECNLLIALGDSFARSEDETAVYGNEEVQPLVENLDDLQEGGIVIYDAGLIDEADLPADFEERADANDWHVYPVDFLGLAREHGSEVMRNTASVGAVTAIVDVLDIEYVEELMRESMSGDILEANIQILEEAHERVNEEFDHTHDIHVPEGEHDEEHVLVSGSEAISYGAIDEGCRFIAGYPMTPWTDVFTIVSKHVEDMGGIAEQVEDEIAAASLAIGASHAGAKAMTGSSGGGFALMSEPLGLAEMTETPLVMVEAMRAGPSTGMPTKSGQGDLEHVLYTSQGDSCRVVFAPGDPKECYELTRQAFRIAYDYQIPTLVVYDSKLSGELRSVPKSFLDREPNPDLGKVLTQDEIPDAPHDHTGRFKRFQHDAEDGVSQRTLPGQRGGRFLATGNEHWPNGQISEDPTNRVRQMDRRLGKLETIRAELDESEHGQTTFGDPDADFGIVTWGSTKGTVEEAVERLKAEGIPVKGLCCGEMVPFPESDVAPFLESVDEAMVVEMNATAQFREHIQKKLGSHEETLTSLLKYNGEPFRVEEVVEAAEIRVTGEPAEPSAQTALEPTEGD